MQPQNMVVYGYIANSPIFHSEGSQHTWIHFAVSASFDNPSMNKPNVRCVATGALAEKLFRILEKGQEVAAYGTRPLCGEKTISQCTAVESTST